MPRRTYRKKIVTNELVKQISLENIKLIEQYLKEKATRCSDDTIKNYRSDANIFFVWNLLNNKNKEFVNIKKLELADFFSYTVNELKWSSARLNRMRSFLSSLSQFIERFLDDEYPNFRNMILKTIESSPKAAVREKTILTDEQVSRLLNHLREKDAQEACWLALAVYSGSRFKELLLFTVDLLDVNHTAFNGIFLETTKQIRTKGRGKAGKLLNKYVLKEEFIEYYQEWLHQREEILKKNNQKHNFLFVKDDGTPATEAVVRSWISEMEKYLGVNLYPHCLRHFLCTELTRKNIPQAFIQFLFGWSSADMYNIYNDLTVKDMQWSLDSLKK